MQSDPISLPNSHTQGEWLEALRKRGKTIEDVAREEYERGYSSGGTSTSGHKNAPAESNEPDDAAQD